MQQHALQYLALFALWAVAFGAGAAALGITLSRFLPAFRAVYSAAGAIYFLGLWDQAAHYNLEPPLVALALRLVDLQYFGRASLACSPGLRVEFYIKTGIVLCWAPELAIDAHCLGRSCTAIVQAAIVSLDDFRHDLFCRRSRFGLDRRLAATLGTGGAVCGVSGAIAVGGAVGAKKEQVAVAISLVVDMGHCHDFLPCRWWPARIGFVHRRVAGAWIGTSEFADAAGLAAAQTYGGYAGSVPGIAPAVRTPQSAAFTLMKVIGRDMWIGVWAFVLSLIATAPAGRSTGVESTGGSNAGEIWRRFPKFVLGFSDRLRACSPSSRSGYEYATYKKEVLPGIGRPFAGVSHLGFHLCLLEHRPHHPRPRLRRGGLEAFLCVHYRRAGECGDRLSLVDIGVRGFLEQIGTMKDAHNSMLCSVPAFRR